MRKSQRVGTKYDPKLDAEIDENQQALVDDLINPHSYQLDEWVCCAGHKICASYPGYQVDAQPTQARGGIVWNRAYHFAPKGPSYLDPTPEDPSTLSQAR